MILTLTAKALPLLHTWLPDSAERVVVLTTRAVAGTLDPAGRSRRFRHVEVAERYDAPAVELGAERLHARFGFERIATVAETDVLRAARLRGRLGVTGQSEESATAFRDKYVMKRRAARAGIPVAPMAPVTAALDIAAFADAQGYPVVVKPRMSSPSARARRIDDEAALLDFVRTGTVRRPDGVPGGWLVESYVTGELCRVDGMMAGDRLVHAWPSAYARGGADPYSRRDRTRSVLLDASDPRTAALRAFAAETVRALPSPSEPTGFCAEIFVGPDGSMTLCEIACRAGGSGITAAYQRAFGVHLLAESLRGQCGVPLALDAQPGRSLPV
ncbi:hypothetical protein AB0C96_25790 [Streptomyces sp. NPDC048506]|uniref:ATP-grasp domain-containing protein n=1 Tax=Streptomyces sp. NPDC048506 TaxID=3155028 RepID=UPI00342AD002